MTECHMFNQITAIFESWKTKFLNIDNSPKKFRRKMNHVKGVAYDPEIVDQFEINAKNELF